MSAEAARVASFMATQERAGSEDPPTGARPPLKLAGETAG